MDPLEQVRKDCLSCRECPLCRTRTNVVFGVGDPAAELMFVGEGPGENEDKQGEPFVGAAGRLLDDMLDMIDLQRSFPQEQDLLEPLIGNDGIHPSVVGQKLIYDVLCGEAKRLFA